MNAQLNAALPTAGPVPELGHLKAAAERLGVVNYNIVTFYERFFGPSPQNGAKDGQDATICYRNDIAAVFEQISRLEEMVNNLPNIG